MKRLKALRELRNALGAEIFLTGGTVRDLLRQRDPNDLDLLVRSIAPSDFEEFLRKRGDLQLVGRSFGVYLFRPKRSKEVMEIAFPRKEQSTGEGHRDFQIIPDPELSIEEDSRRRDFTCNAMYVSIDHVDDTGNFDRKSVVDFHSGLEHIRKRLVVAVGDPDKRIQEDPLRMLRAAVLVARTGYRLEGNTFAAIKRNARLIETVAPERVRDEIIKIMRTDKPSRAFKAMQRTGLLDIFLPELAACAGVGQNPKHHSYPVFEHLIYATDAACRLTDRLDVRFGALCHDLGKAPTRQVKPGGDGPNDVTFHNHEIVSTKLAYAMMSRLRFSHEFRDEVIHLVRHHQYKYDRVWTNKAVRRFIRNTGITRDQLDNLDQHPQFLLRQADRMGNELKAHLPITQKQRDFQDRIRKVYAESSAHSLRDLRVNGKDLMRELGLSPSPVIGKIMAHLFDVVEGDPKENTPERLLEIAANFLEEEAESGSGSNNRESQNQSTRASE